MAKHRKDWNTEPTSPYVDPQQKASEFDAQYEQNHDAGKQRAEQDPYRRPQPTSQKKSWG